MKSMGVLWSDYYGAALVGAEGEIACLPHKGCRLEVVATAESSHREVNLILPGQVIRYKGSLCFLDRFELPSGTTVGLWHLVGFKVRLVSGAITSVPSEDAGTNLALASDAPAATNFLVALRMSRRPYASGQITCQRRSGGGMRVRELARVEVADQRLGDDYEGKGGPGVHGGLGQRRSDGSGHGSTGRAPPRILNFVGGAESEQLGVDLGTAGAKSIDGGPARSEARADPRPPAVAAPHGRPFLETLALPDPARTSDGARARTPYRPGQQA